MKTIKTALLSTLLFFSVVSLAQSNLKNILHDFKKRPDRVLVAAHRASHNQYPENSLAAMKEAIRTGVDVIETDVRETKDGVLVIMHDKTINRTTTGKGEVEALTYAELQQFFLLYKGQPTREKIPALEEVFQLVKGKIMLDIDYKADGERALQSTVKLIRKHKMEKQSLFFLYDYKDAAAVYKLNHRIRLMTRAYSAEDVAGILQLNMKVPVIHVDDKFYSDSLMAGIRNNKKRVWSNALGKYDEMETSKPGSGFDLLFQMKQLNMIQTDKPEELLKYLKSKNLHR